MNISSRFWNRLKLEIWKVAHKCWEKKLRKKVISQDITIISPNCTGGVMYHDLGFRFCSPTVNLFLDAEDYLELCEDLPRYVHAEMKPYTGSIKRTYPMADLDGLTLYLVHFKSLEEAKQKREERAQRIHWDNIVVLGADRDGMTPELMVRFDKLPYRKIMFVKDTPRYAWQFQICNCIETNQVGTILHPDTTTLKAALTGKRFYDQFDWVGFLNQGQSI